MKPQLLKEIRERLGLTVGDFADILGLMPRTYYRYESGKTPIPFIVEKCIITLLKYPNVLKDAMQGVRREDPDTPLSAAPPQ